MITRSDIVLIAYTVLTTYRPGSRREAVSSVLGTLAVVSIGMISPALAVSLFSHRRKPQ